MFRNAVQYSKYHRMQIRDAKLLLSDFCPKLNWEEHAETVVDIGCGSGDTTKELILPELKNLKRLLAFDLLEPMIEFARENNCHSKIEYSVANAEDWESFSHLEGQVSKVFSVYCLHWVRNQKKAFQNIYRMLKNGGEVVLLMILSYDLWECYPEIIANPRWNKILKSFSEYIPESQLKKYGASYYSDLLESIGFKVLTNKEEEKTFCYDVNSEFKSALTSRGFIINDIPEELRPEFQSDLWELFVKMYPIKDGKMTPHYHTLSLHLRKE